MSPVTMRGAFEPSILTIFGITGDLSHRKLLPALYHLAEDGLLPKEMRIVGISRNGTTVDELLSKIQQSVEATGVQCKQDALDWLRGAISVITMDLTKPEEYQRLKKELDALEDSVGMCLHRLFYLSVPANAFQPVVEQLGEQHLNNGCQHGHTESRLLIEKPFGSDMKSATELIETLRHSFEEHQIYRIDHYLAKETVQNILRFRFENPIFNSDWGRDHISSIMITAAESIGIEGRTSFYEGVGALRDLVQSHLLQILALVTMDRPEQMKAEQIHQQKQKLFAAMQSPSSDEIGTSTVRGQYKSYRNEVEDDESQTETYAAIRVNIDNDRWRGVPMLIRTGKALTEKVTEVVITFQDPERKSSTNTLTIRVQPHEGIVLDLRIKKPGFDNDEIQHTQMSFCYAGTLGASHPDAYERVLVDAMRGDKTLFATSSEVLDSWRVIDPILGAWQKNEAPLETYESGSWGPESADTMVKKLGAKWLTGTPFVCSVQMKDEEPKS